MVDVGVTVKFLSAFALDKSWSSSTAREVFQVRRAWDLALSGPGSVR